MADRLLFSAFFHLPQPSLIAASSSVLPVPFSAENGTGKTELLAAISDGCGR